MDSPSGLFMTVWTDSVSDRDWLLKYSGGGWPHITLAYTGSSVEFPEILEMGSFALSLLAGRTVQVDRAVVSSWEKEGKQMHDVLLAFDAENEQFIKNAQAQLLDKYWGGDRVPKPSMHATPHVTYQTGYKTREEAERVAEILTSHFKMRKISLCVNGIFYT